MTTVMDGQIAFEHFHRYCIARDLCVGLDVLDVASGEGYGSAMLAGVARSVTGVEIDAQTVSHAREAYKLENLSFKQGSALALPLDDASVDIIVTFETLEHIREHEVFVAEIKRVLRPGGLFVVSSPDRAVYSALAEQVNEYHLRELTEAEFESFLRSNFKNSALFQQRAIFGSLVAATEGASHWRSYEQRAAAFIEASDGLARAPYLIGVASDSDLPGLASSVFIGRHGMHEATQAFAARLQELQNVVSQRELDATAALNAKAEAELRANERERERDEARAAHSALAAQTVQIIRDRDEARAAHSALEAQTVQIIRDRDELRAPYDNLLAPTWSLSANVVSDWKYPRKLRGMKKFLALFSRKRRTRLRRERREYAILKRSALFSPQWYMGEYSHLNSRDWDPILHYIRYGWRLDYRPGPMFDGARYRAAYPDVGGVNPLWHFLVFGVSRGRFEGTPFGHLFREPDLRSAGSTSEIAAPGDSPGNDIAPSAPADRESFASAVSPWSSYGVVSGYAWENLGRSPALHDLAFCKTLNDADLVRIVAKLDFSPPASAVPGPRVSIIIPCLNNERLTAECLASIRRAASVNLDVEIILIDNASSDPLYASLASRPGLKVLRFEKNLGYGPACNEGAALATGEFLFFLNNDAQISPGCLEILIEAFTGEGGEAVGIAGPKLVSFDGRLQEAGCLLNPDGTGTLVGFGGDHTAPRFNYPRPCDHISGAAVLMRRSLFEQLGGFDPIFAPAYCEDADLSLKVRALDKLLIYVPAAVVAHHLSATSLAQTRENVSKRQLIARNRNIFVKRWAGRLANNDLRTIAFYLPQYHPVPENDLWWGKGFTEWMNVTKARPNYVGHDQPRYPADLGYYDLRLNETMVAQAKLAERYGITGFCYYYYWFSGKRMLETPLEQMLDSGKPDFPFCLCWANENWTRRWDGQDQDVLLSQDYSNEHNEAVIEDLSRYFRAKAYIRVNGRPLLLIYRVQDLPSPKTITSLWRDYCRKNGIGEICIAMVETFELAAKPQPPANYGCDLSVEFPPHFLAGTRLDVEQTNPKWTGEARDYRALAKAFMQRDEVGFQRLRSVLVGWDHTARRQDGSVILECSNPGAFQAWLEWTYRRTLEQNYGDERIVFINAWNEWCEGSYLEPDRRFGHGYLQAVQNALESIKVGGHAFVEIAD
jgi:GT2 family glycosyltransferase/ubiquinone/menaquinone biosynthesis C-methylase UbiE